MSLDDHEMGTSNPGTDVADSRQAVMLRLERICREFNVDSLLPQIGAGEEVLREHGVVDVAVLGQFKAGKSSFLNGLIGRDVLPVNVLPATAVITRIGHGPADRALARHMDGRAREIPLEDLPEFVTEQRNPGNAKQVSIVDVELPVLADFRGMRFVDTPGLGSVFAHNTKVSMEWLPRVGGALVAVSVNHPLSEQDLNLLLEVFRHTPETAILLTKADLVTGEQLEAVVEFTKRQVIRHTGKDVAILPFSNRPGFDALRNAVREHLFRRIVHRREETFEEIVDHKIRFLVGECRQYLALAHRVAETAGKAREELREVLEREDRDLGAVKSEIGLQIRDIESRVRTAAGERFHSHHREILDRMVSRLGEAGKEWTGNLAKVTGAFREWLLEALSEELAEVSFHGETHLAGFLVTSQSSFQRTVRAFQDRLAKEIERALGIPFTGARFHAEIEEPARPDVRVGKTFDSQVDLLWFLVPMSVFRSLVLRHFRKQVVWEVEKNLSRLASQWADAVNRSIGGLARQSLEFMRGEAATIRSLVENAEDRRDDIRKAIAELDHLESSLSGSPREGAC
ncbi:MAG: dynamin family protein [Deltaproteobacteria bacterium]|nr:dynamin family protein [Deltaproteobacteria bacterium]